MRVQLAFRNTVEVWHDHAMLMTSGICEVDAATAGRYAENFVSTRIEFAADGHPICLLTTNNIYAPKAGFWQPEPLETTEIESYLTAQLDRIIPGPFSNAELLMRRTLIEPSAPGNVVMAFSGLVGVHPVITPDCDHVHELATDARTGVENFMRYVGRLGYDLRPEWDIPALIEATRGKNMQAFLRLPIWGFSERPVGLRSTLPIETLDKLDRYRDLDMAGPGNRDNDEFSRLRLLARETGHDNTDRYPMFKAMISILHAEDALPRSAKPMTDLELGEHEERIYSIVGKLMEREKVSATSLSF